MAPPRASWDRPGGQAPRSRAPTRRWQKAPPPPPRHLRASDHICSLPDSCWVRVNTDRTPTRRPSPIIIPETLPHSAVSPQASSPTLSLRSPRRTSNPPAAPYLHAPSLLLLERPTQPSRGLDPPCLLAGSSPTPQGRRQRWGPFLPCGHFLALFQSQWAPLGPRLF